ncbi:MAG: hypothetical protein UE068_03080 [Paludibacteraceae bacterium]|nr:hypothetical protein [Paludibacteraceae bacterium]
MNKEEEFQMQLANGDLRVLDDLKGYPDLCKFYKDNFDDISSFIERNGPKVAIEDMEKLGMPKIEDISYFDEFIKQINNAIKREGIKKDDL